MRGFEFQEVNQDRPCGACLPADCLHSDPVVAVLKTGDHTVSLCGYHVQLLIMGLVESLVNATYEAGTEERRQ